MKLSYITSRYGLRFDLDTFFARFGPYRKLMFKLFKRRYFISETKYQPFPSDMKRPELILFIREKE